MEGDAAGFWDPAFGLVDGVPVGACGAGAADGAVGGNDGAAGTCGGALWAKTGVEMVPRAKTMGKSVDAMRGRVVIGIPWRAKWVPSGLRGRVCRRCG